MSAIDHSKELRKVVGHLGGNFLRAYGGTSLRLVGAIIGDIIGGFGRWVLGKLPGRKQSGKPARADGMPADVAKLITLVCAMINEAHAHAKPGEDPNRGESIRAFLGNLDFGEILQTVEGSDPYVLKAVEAFNEELWKYPAKVGTLVATLIPLINIIIKTSREVMVPIEKTIGPDLLADIILSLVKGLNGAELAKLINTSEEVLRRVHTGSLLLGKGGKPLMQIYLTDLLKDCMPQMNSELLKKTRITLSEDKLSIAQAVADALTDNPALTVSYLASAGSVRNSALKARARKLRVYEDLDQEKFTTALSQSMSDVDTYEIAKLVNTICRLLNRLHTAKPEFLSNLASGIVDSLDQEELKNTTRWVVADLVQAFKPLAPTLMPVFIKGLNDLLSPQSGNDNREQAEALQTLRATVAQTAGGEQ
jgi:triphosphoribosyl-dephospho-CoA synthetase